MESQNLQGDATLDQSKSRRFPGWLKVVLLVVLVGVILNAGVALARLDGKFISRQDSGISKALGAFRAPVDYQFTGQGRIVGGVGKTWVVSGVPVRLGEHTHIIGDVRASDAVILSGQILESGIWLADRIERADVQESIFTYNGTLDAIQAEIWRVGGLDLVVNETTQIIGTMAVSDQVLATFIPNSDGSRQALTIEPFDQPWVEPTPVSTAAPLSTEPPASQPASDDPPQKKSPDADHPKEKKSDNQGSVTVCHKSGKKGGHTMTVNGPALQSHLKHGDTLGPCP